MPMRDRRCPECGWSKDDNYEPRTAMDVLCPNGHKTEILFTSNVSIHGDDQFVGGKTFENLGNRPVTVHSRSELKREMAARGLQPFVRHVGERGSDRSKHTTRWI